MALFATLAAVLTAASFGLPPVAPTQALVATPPIAIAPAPVASIGPAKTVLAKGTMVRLMVLKEINSRDHAAGHRFVLRVDEDVTVDGITVIPVGAKGWGEVVAAQGTGAVGKNGRINARLLHVEADGQQIALDGQRESTGRGGTGQAVASVLAFGVFGLLMKGNNATLKAGEIINGYTASDMAFDRSPPVITQ